MSMLMKSIQVLICQTKPVDYFCPSGHSLAESQGFEPRIPLITEYTISSRAPSTSSANSPTIDISDLIIHFRLLITAFFKEVLQ